MRQEIKKTPAWSGNTIIPSEPTFSAVPTTPSPMKLVLTKELDDAMKQIDKVGTSALDMSSSFDNLKWTPKPMDRAPMSLSEDTVPIDNHILNWRELVGLPSTNSLSNDKELVSLKSTPMLTGKFSQGFSSVEYGKEFRM